MSDGWTNQRGESVVNYIANTRQHAIFVGSDVTGSERHTGDMIAAGLASTIEGLGGPEAVIAVTTDNASNMRAARQRLEQRYPGLITIGCASHMVNLTVEEILSASTISTYLSEAVNIIRHFKSSPILTGMLNDVAQAENTRRKALQLPGNTRWQGKLEAIDSLLVNRSYLETAIRDEIRCLNSSATTDQRAKYRSIRDTIHDDVFWGKIRRLQRFLQPFLQVTLQLESQKPRGSRIYAYFGWLYSQADGSGVLPADQLKEIISRRWAAVHHPLFTIAYICDPATRDERPITIPNGQRRQVTDWLKAQYPVAEAAAIWRDLQFVWSKQCVFDDQIEWESSKTYPDLANWWATLAERADCSPQLADLAIKALSIHPTTGSAERNWSIHGFLHSKGRNRLTNERVRKLVFVYQNLTLRDQNPVELSPFFDDDEVSVADDLQLDCGQQQPDNSCQFDGVTEASADDFGPLIDPEILI